MQGTTGQSPIPSHPLSHQLGSELGEFFYKKIELIKADIDHIEVDTPYAEFQSPEIKLDSFSLLSEDDVYVILL